MDKTPERKLINWDRWLGFGLLAVVAAAVAQPVCQFVELVYLFAAMGRVGG